MMTRRKSRELALQMLFQWDITKVAPQEVEETFWVVREEKAEEYPFARKLFAAATSQAKAIDEIIMRHSEHWRLERMPIVDRNVLRLAIAEFLAEPETPRVVVINEALEIARRFSDPESVQFVNGILDHVKDNIKSDSPSTETADKPIRRQRRKE